MSDHNTHVHVTRAGWADSIEVRRSAFGRSADDIRINGKPFPWAIEDAPITARVDPQTGIAYVTLTLMTDNFSSTTVTSPAEASA